MRASVSVRLIVATLVVAAVSSPVAAARTGTAGGAGARCGPQVVTVTDIASPTSTMDAVDAILRGTGACVTAFSPGVTTLARAAHRAGAPLVGGLTALEDGAAEFDRLLGTIPPGPVTVVAHGAGGLLAQYARLHGRHGARIAELVTIGPMWRGTDIGGIAQVEAQSRRIGTYDTILAAEKPVVDPVCAGCREIVGGSDFLVGLTRDGLRSVGVRYVDIISLDDGLVSDPLSAAIPGSTVHTVRGPAFHHFTLPADRLVGALVTSSVRR